MSRSLAISLKRPHEQLCLPVPFGRRVADVARGAWVGTLAVVIVVFVGLYVYQVNVVASKGFELRALEKRAERLRDRVSALEEKTIEMQSVRALESRISGLGYVPLQNVRYLK